MADSGRDEHGKASLWMEPASSAPRCAAAQRPNSIQVPTSDAPPPSSRGDDPQGDTAVHAGGARARGRAADIVSVAVIAAVSVLLTLLMAGTLQVSVRVGLSPPAAPQTQTRDPRPSGLSPEAPSPLGLKTSPLGNSSRWPADATGKDSKRGSCMRACVVQPILSKYA